MSNRYFRKNKVTYQSVPRDYHRQNNHYLVFGTMELECTPVEDTSYHEQYYYEQNVSDEETDDYEDSNCDDEEGSGGGNSGGAVQTIVGLLFARVLIFNIFSGDDDKPVQETTKTEQQV